MVKRIALSTLFFIVLAATVHAGCVTRYFVLPETQIDRQKYTAILYPDGGDNLPLSDLPVTVYPHPVNDGRYLVKANLTQYILSAMADGLNAETVLSPAGVVELDIVGSYAGETRDEVLLKFPELAGQVQVGTDEQGQPIMVDKFPRKRWSCE